MNEITLAQFELWLRKTIVDNGAVMFKMADDSELEFSYSEKLIFDHASYIFNTCHSAILSINEFRKVAGGAA